MAGRGERIVVYPEGLARLPPQLAVGDALLVLLGSADAVTRDGRALAGAAHAAGATHSRAQSRSSAADRGSPLLADANQL